MPTTSAFASKRTVNSSIASMSQEKKNGAADDGPERDVLVALVCVERDLDGRCNHSLVVADLVNVHVVRIVPLPGFAVSPQFGGETQGLLEIGLHVVVQVATRTPVWMPKAGAHVPRFILAVLAEVEQDVAILMRMASAMGFQKSGVLKPGRSRFSLFSTPPPLHWSYLSKSKPQRAYCSASCC